jgi:hypothetical protein
LIPFAATVAPDDCIVTAVSFAESIVVNCKPVAVIKSAAAIEVLLLLNTLNCRELLIITAATYLPRDCDASTLSRIHHRPHRPSRMRSTRLPLGEYSTKNCCHWPR